MIFLTFLTAIALSGVAGYYSIVGLASIFPGSYLPVMIMGSVLETSKLVTVSWLYNNWKQCPLLIKTYLCMAVAILMLITSMGIFGFLSKAHLEHSSDSAPLLNNIAILDEKIKTEKENVDANRKILKQYDEIVDQTMGRTTDEKGTDKAQAIRRTQQKDRSRILQEINQSQTTIAAYSEERAPLSNELKKTEADVGPIKYIAALLYSETVNADILDKAVRLVILLIIVVFDPLAVLLLIAANMSIKKPEPPKPIVKETEIQEEMDIPVFVPKDDSIHVEKDNLANIVIDEMTGESIPPISGTKKLKPKYDYSEPFSFKENK
jgi:hypothetical protein